MRQLQNDLEKIGSFYQNHRSNIPPDSAFTYGLINNSFDFIGGRTRTRTLDPLIKSPIFRMRNQLLSCKLRQNSTKERQ